MCVESENVSKNLLQCLQLLSDSGPDSLSLTSETSEERFDFLDLPDSESRRRCLHSIDFTPKIPATQP